MYLEIKDVKKSYGEDGSFVQVLNGITTEVEHGEMCVIQGTSGSGKSTLLKIIAGVEEPDEGQVVKGRGIELAYLVRIPPCKFGIYFSVLQSCTESYGKRKYSGV